MQHARPGAWRQRVRAGWIWKGWRGGTASAPVCCLAGAKRSAPSGRSASSALSAVTATMGASARPPPAPASVSLATKAHAARSGCAPRDCMAQAAPCLAPVMPTTPSGMSWGPGGLGMLGWAGTGREGTSQGIDIPSRPCLQLGDPGRTAKELGPQ